MRKLITANTAGGQRRALQVFRDFCELAALSIRNAVDSTGHAAREERYLQLLAGYTREEQLRFPEMLAWVANALTDNVTDVLGHEYMSLGFGNDRLGQFFTPYDVSVLAARVTVGSLTDQLTTRGFIAVGEPACGSGGMIIAMAEALRDEGVNYQRELHATATDLDATAVHMTYIQLALLHIPAVVNHGNTLTMDVIDAWPTPAHVLGAWSERLEKASG